MPHLRAFMDVQWLSSEGALLAEPWFMVLPSSPPVLGPVKQGHVMVSETKTIMPGVGAKGIEFAHLGLYASC